MIATNKFCLFNLPLQAITHDGQLCLSLLQCLQSLVHGLALLQPLLKVPQQGGVAHQTPLLTQTHVV